MTEWQPIDHVSLSIAQKYWLAERGSLTQRLRQQLGEQFHLTLLNEYWQQVTPFEAEKLNVLPDEFVKHREIFLGSKTTPYLFGRSLFPQSVLSKPEFQLDVLGDRPLGEVLFAHPDIRRETIFVKPLSEKDECIQQLRQYTDVEIKNPYYRYSTFSINGSRIMLYEVFLDS